MVLTAIEVLIALTTMFLSCVCVAKSFAEIHQKLRTNDHFLVPPSRTALEADQDGHDGGKNDDGANDPGPKRQPTKFNVNSEAGRAALLRAEVDIKSQTTTARDKITRELAVKNTLLAIRSTAFPNGLLIGEARISKVLQQEIEGKAKRDVGDQFDSSGEHLQHTNSEIDRLVEEYKAQVEEKRKFDSMSQENKNEAMARQELLKQKSDEAREQALRNMRSPPSGTRAS